LLAVGLKQSGFIRAAAILGAAATAAVAPTSGSRSPIVLGAAALLAVFWGAGLVRTRIGRRILVGGALAATLAVVAVPEAVEGVEARFNADAEETRGRVLDTLDILPPVALTRYEYEPFGRGSGMLQSARFSFGVALHPNDVEGEQGRILLEQGIVGYCLVWIARLGLVLALLRASVRFKRAGEGAFRGLSIALAVVPLFSYLVFDHVITALLFTAVGLVLRAAAALPAPPAAPAAPPRPRGHAPRFGRVPG
jgi:hypothetical protein